ncbi:hypothetical protein Bbelb_209700 [Branchiostoma belcheri]|nr:hypothetical protein Bbelb_209700 [Branchiostoma belcheri]
MSSKKVKTPSQDVREVRTSQKPAKTAKESHAEERNREDGSAARRAGDSSVTHMEREPAQGGFPRGGPHVAAAAAYGPNPWFNFMPPPPSPLGYGFPAPPTSAFESRMSAMERTLQDVTTALQAIQSYRTGGPGPSCSADSQSYASGSDSEDGEENQSASEEAEEEGMSFDNPYNESNSGLSPASEDLKKYLNDLFTRRLPKEEYEKRCGQYSVPSNLIDIVSAPTLPPDQSALLESKTAEGERKLLGLHSRFMQVAKPLTHCLYELKYDRRPCDKDFVVETLESALVLLGSASFNFSLHRRDQCANLVGKKELKHLLSEDNPTSKHLFGDDFVNQVKNASTSKKALGGVFSSGGHYNQKYNPKKDFRNKSKGLVTPRSPPPGPPSLQYHNFHLPTCHLPSVGRTAHFVHNWRMITQDNWVLDTIQGYRLELSSQPSQIHIPVTKVRPGSDTILIDQEVEKLLSKGAIQRALPTTDLKDAYFTVPIFHNHRKYLRFIWKDSLYEFAVLPFGLSSAPRVFTKILKPIAAQLRALGVRLVIYLDDILIMAQSADLCREHTALTRSFLENLGFVVNLEKSQLTPSQTREFLGFTICSVKMEVLLPDQKVLKIVDRCQNLLSKGKASLQELASLVGLLSSTSQAVPLAPLHYRYLQKDLRLGLKKSGHYSSVIRLSPMARQDLCWWPKSLTNSNGAQLRPQTVLEVQSDASLQGWGGFSQEKKAGGRWSSLEKADHINVLELKAAFLSLQSFAQNVPRGLVKMKLDNTTAVAYINRKGGTKSVQLMKLSLEMWNWALQRGLMLTASHVEGAKNQIADTLSRVFNDRTEWQLNPEVFRKLSEFMPGVTIDLFASRLNAQLPRYVAWMSDPAAVAVDAFTIDWGQEIAYAYPPTVLIPRILNKVVQDQATMFLLAPVWQTQVWYPLMLELLFAPPVLLPRSEDLIKLPHNGQTHPLLPEMRLALWPLCGTTSKVQAFRLGLQTSCCPHGGKVLRNSTRVPGIDYLHSLYARGLEYRSIGVARSAISAVHAPIDGVNVGAHPYVVKLMKGVFQSRPPRPRYVVTWDVSKVTSYLRTLSPAKMLSLKQLSFKTAMLCALTSADRGSTLAVLDTRQMSIKHNGVLFVLSELTKTSRPNKPYKKVFLPSFPQDKKLCPKTYVEKYLARTKPLRRDEKYLFVSFKKPHKAVGTSSIARWIKSVMSLAGIDTAQYSAHSTRGAASSAAERSGLSTTEILRAADWSSESTFATFYKRDLEESDFGRAVLDVASKSAH